MISKRMMVKTNQQHSNSIQPYMVAAHTSHACYCFVMFFFTLSLLVHKKSVFQFRFCQSMAFFSCINSLNSASILIIHAIFLETCLFLQYSFILKIHIFITAQSFFRLFKWSTLDAMKNKILYIYFQVPMIVLF